MTTQIETADLTAGKWRSLRPSLSWRKKLAFTGIFFTVLLVVCLFAEFIANDRPLVIHYEGHWYFPVFQTLYR